VRAAGVGLASGAGIGALTALGSAGHVTPTTVLALVSAEATATVASLAAAARTELQATSSEAEAPILIEEASESPPDISEPSSP
jgi:hypothetical protein